MINFKAKARMNMQAVKRAAGRAEIKTYQQAGRLIYRIARNSIRRRKNKSAHSPAGTPPFTHTGALKRSIRFAATDQNVVVGATLSEIGMVANLHEFGGKRAASPQLPPDAAHGWPRKKHRTSYHNNWKLQIGGHGPIEIGPSRWVKRGNQKVYSSVYFAKLTTANMVAKAKSIANDAEKMLIAEQYHGGESNEVSMSNCDETARFPPRPFMGPALIKAEPYLPHLWRNTIHQ